jgi:DNA-damage-inducible protein D
MTNIKLFEDQKIRSHFDETNEKWFFSVVDVVTVLTQSVDSTAYWRKLKQRLKEEGNETVTNCHGLKMMAVDGKMRLTDVSDVEGLLRLIQSIPSPKAEPFKLWLAKVGYERMQDMSDPALSVDRAREYWQSHGRSEKWIQQRLTDYWKSSGVEKADEFAMLTNIIHQEWSGLSVKGHKEVKGLKTQNLRDHMSEAELIFTALAEMSTRQIAEVESAQGVDENAKAGKKGGAIAKGARVELENKTGKSVITGENFLPLKKVGE